MSEESEPTLRWRPPRHVAFLTALVLAVAVRVVVMVAYRPALLFTDSFSYLQHADPLQLSHSRPVGYSVALHPLLRVTDSLTAIAAIQHLVGLGLAVGCYAFLVRRGLPGWGATLAVLPLLFDPLQLVLEHYVLSDVLFEALVVTACLAVLWRPRPGPVGVVVAGAAVGAAATVRGAGSFLAIGFLVALLCLRLGWTRLVVFAVSAALPVGAYAVGFHRQWGEYAVANAGPRFLWARVAPLVYCQDPQLRLPSYERMLCPNQPIDQRPTSRYYMWGTQREPAYRVQPPPGITKLQAVEDFDRRVVRAQPVAYTRAVLADLARGFAPSRAYAVPGYYPSTYWLFADHYWSLDNIAPQKYWSRKVLNSTGYDPAAARVMTAYRHWVFTPGPLMAALLLAAAAAVVGVGRSRRSGDRVAVGLLAGSCLLTLLTGAALSGFSWRYQLPQVPLLPLAGALGVAALVRGRAPGRVEPAPPLRLLDRAAARLVAVPMPAGWRPALVRGVERGWLPAALAVLAGAVSGCVVGALAAGSGWFLPLLAGLVGLAVAVLVAGTLLVARSRARSGSTRPPEDPRALEEPPSPVTAGC